MDLRELLLNESLDFQEIHEVLLHHFKTSFHEDDNILKYGNAERIFVEVHFTDGKNVRDIKFPTPMSNDKQWLICADIMTEILGSQTESIGSSVIYSNSKINKYYRFDDVFQLIPLPIPALQPNSHHPPYPFLIEVSYKSSNIAGLSSYRFNKQLQKWKLILFVLLNKNIFFQPSYNGRVWVTDYFKTPPENFCASIGYFYNSENLLPCFSPQVAERMAHVPFGKYYFSYPPPGAELSIPDNLTVSLNRFLRLSEEAKDKFLQAARWLHFAHEAKVQFQSASYAAFVSAIEALLDHSNSAPKEVCPCCNKLKTGPTSNFKDFLDRFARIKRTSQDDYYKIRSNIVHGKYIIPDDKSPLTWLPESNFRRQELMKLDKVAHICIFNWLHASDVSITDPFYLYLN